MKWAVICILAAFSQACMAENSLQVNFRWQIAHHCTNTSPLIQLKNIPPGTTHLLVEMKDLDSENPLHGGGGGELVDESGFPAEYTIASGALNKYQGPCPDNFTGLGHEYQIKVTAFNDQRQTLAQGAHQAPFSGKFVILQGVIGSP